jgi:hypothetical protein
LLTYMKLAGFKRYVLRHLRALRVEQDAECEHWNAGGSTLLEPRNTASMPIPKAWYPRVRGKFKVWLEFYQKIDPIFTEEYLLGEGENGTKHAQP